MSKILMNCVFLILLCSALTSQIQITQTQRTLESFGTNDSYDKVMEWLKTGFKVLILFKDSKNMLARPTEQAAINTLIGEFSYQVNFKLIQSLTSFDLDRAFQTFNTNSALTYVIYRDGSLLANIPNDIFKVRRALDKALP